jgi:hypothetical protein
VGYFIGHGDVKAHIVAAEVAMLARRAKTRIISVTETRYARNFQGETRESPVRA